MSVPCEVVVYVLYAIGTRGGFGLVWGMLLCDNQSMPIQRFNDFGHGKGTRCVVVELDDFGIGFCDAHPCKAAHVVQSRSLKQTHGAGSCSRAIVHPTPSLQGGCRQALQRFSVAEVRGKFAPV